MTRTKETGTGPAKKVCAGLLAVLVMAISAHAGGEPALRVVTSFYPIHIAVLNVVGEAPGVTVACMARQASGCLHDYQMTPGDMATLSEANVFVVNGLGMESFLDDAIRRKPGLEVICASAGIQPIVSRGETNAHVWVSPALHRQQVVNIAEGLARLDPGRSTVYRRNAAAYGARLESLSGRMQASLREVTTRRVITMHEAFPYFASEFGLNVVTVIEREPGSDPTARELADTIRVVREAGVRALFAEPQYSSKAADTIAAATGVGVHCLDPVVTGPFKPDAYLDIMARNLAALKAALQ